MTEFPGRSLAVLSLLMLAIAAGCSDPSVAIKQDQTTNTGAANSGDAPEVDSMTKELTADSTAAEVCERFMLLLQNGKRIEAEALLSRRARKTITEVGLELDLAGNSSKVSVSDAIYATSLAKVAQVTSHIGAGIEQQDFTWMLRKTKPGWRITGLIVPGKQGLDLHSLESRPDVATIQKAMGGSSAADTSDVRQVSAEEEIDQD